jgi:hypothetical protein
MNQEPKVLLHKGIESCFKNKVILKYDLKLCFYHQIKTPFSKLNVATVTQEFFKAILKKKNLTLLGCCCYSLVMRSVILLTLISSDADSVRARAHTIKKLYKLP